MQAVRVVFKLWKVTEGHAVMIYALIRKVGSSDANSSMPLGMTLEQGVGAVFLKDAALPACSILPEPICKKGHL